MLNTNASENSEQVVGHA